MPPFRHSRLFISIGDDTHQQLSFGHNCVRVKVYGQMDSSSAVEEANYPAKPKNSVDKTTVKRWLAGADTGDGDGGDECDAEAWETLNKGFKEAQSVLDQNRLLIEQVNENHQSKIPDKLVKNVALIQEINGNISKVSSVYSNLSVNFSKFVHQRRIKSKNDKLELADS